MSYTPYYGYHVCATKYGRLAERAPSEIMFFIQRFLEPRFAMIGAEGAGHRTLTVPSESSDSELAEETSQIERLIAGEVVPFPLDSTMTVVKDSGGGGLTLHSVVKADAALIAAVAALGEVTSIVAPNLQHWLFIKEWADAYPDASIWLADAAHGEDLHEKLAMVISWAGLCFLYRNNRLITFIILIKKRTENPATLQTHAKSAR